MQIRTFLLSVAVIFQFSPVARATDRCEGKVTESVLSSESISNLYFDLKFHEMICGYVSPGGTAALSAKILDVRTKYKPCIIESQDELVRVLGSEKAFDNFYAAIGNSLSLLRVPDPCGRAEQIANEILAGSLQCKPALSELYKLKLAALATAYELASKRTFKRICDPAL